MHEAAVMRVHEAIDRGTAVIEHHYPRLLEQSQSAAVHLSAEAMHEQRMELKLQKAQIQAGLTLGERSRQQ